MTKKPIYNRILLKISGEALAGPDGFGIDPDRADNLAEHLETVYDLGVEIAIEMKSHFQREHFKALAGAIQVLCHRPEINISDGSITAGVEFIEQLWTE